MHVPVAVYHEEWERLAKGDAWGHLPGTGPYVGVQGESNTDTAKVARVLPGAPAEKAGIRAGDVIVSFAGKKVTDFASLQALVSDSDPGDKVTVEVLRDGKTVPLQLVVGKQAGEKEG
jgi:S1-C subfamily serine protease